MAKRAKRSPRSKPAPKPAQRRRGARHYIVRLDTYEGADTALYLLGADPMWIVISASPTGGAAVVDCGYRSVKEAREAWPEAVAPRPEDNQPERDPYGFRPVFSEPWFQEFWKKLKEQQATPERE
jgi:hypothetical protein